MIRHRLTLGLALALVAAPTDARSDVWREESEKTVESRGLRGVRIDNPRGTVTVRGDSGGSIRLTALKIVRTTDRRQSDRFARETQVVTSTESGTFVVRVRYPQRQSIKLNFWEMFSGFELPRVEVRLEVVIPDGFAATLHSTSGTLSTEEVTGPQVLETTSGDVSIRGARSPVEARSTSGDITATDVRALRIETVSGDLIVEKVRGPLRGGTTSGEISVKGAEDTLQLSTVSGDIRVDAAPHGVAGRSTSGNISVHLAAGGVRLETSSGDVSLGLASPLTRADVSTVSGDIVAMLGGSVGCALEMRSTNGTIDLAVPVEVKTVSRHLVTGVVNNGSAPVRLRTSSGDIRLSTGEN